MPVLTRKSLQYATLEAIEQAREHKCIWHEKYSTDTWETAFRFITECVYTKDDADPEAPVKLIPPKPYIAWLVYEWWKSKSEGVPILIEKSRRMIVSWLLAGLDVWDAGLRGGAFYVASQKYEDAAKLVWRRYFIYQELRKRFRNWNLPKATRSVWGSPYQIRKLLIEGAIFQPLTGSDPDSFRQEGATRVTLDEFAFYDQPEACFSSAKIMTTAPPPKVGGHLVGVTTVKVTPSYLRMIARCTKQH